MEYSRYNELKNSYKPFSGEYPMNINEPYPLLAQLIKQLTQGRKYKICIHDTSGMLHSNPYLTLMPTGFTHNHDFCNTAKLTSKGYKTCLYCKSLTLKKALQSQDPFLGQCYLGQTEVIKPVYINNKLVCVIYLGNLLDLSEKNEVISKIKRNAPLIGIKPDKFQSFLDNMHGFDKKDIDTYLEIIELITQFITFAHIQFQKTLLLQHDTSPIFRGNIHSAVRIVADYISVHYNLNIQLEQLAKICFLNPEYLSKLFKKETGTSLVDYINSIRIQRAKDLLAYTDEKIIDISLLVGFNSNSYFCRIFKQNTGFSPSNFRDHSKKAD